MPELQRLWALIGDEDGDSKVDNAVRAVEAAFAALYVDLRLDGNISASAITRSASLLAWGMKRLRRGEGHQLPPESKRGHKRAARRSHSTRSL